MPSRPHSDESPPAPQMGLFSESSKAAPERRPAGSVQELRRRLLPAQPERRVTHAEAAENALPAWHRAGDPASLLDKWQPDLEQVGEQVGEQDREQEREGRRIWTVADLVARVRTHMEQAWPDLWVHGEISNLRTAPSGHLYFTLKDGESQLPAVLFRRQAQLLRFRPEDGIEVLLRGKVSIYEQRGQMQLIAEHLEPVGAGSLQIAFEQLKARLDAEGLFAQERKRALPPYPGCVGIVTSPTGAVIRDFLNVAGRRHPALDILLYPAVVQGPGAAAEIAAGIAYFNQAQNVDVIVIARGGGSLEDLAPFNTELVARAIASSALPVVSAVGHETDFTIADFVADLRAPTPSAAAELITSAQHRVQEQVGELGARLVRACRYQLMLGRQRLSVFAMQGVEARLAEGLNRREQRVDTLRYRMETLMRSRLHGEAARVAAVSVDAARARLLRGLGERLRSIEGSVFRLQTAQLRSLQGHRGQVQNNAAALLRHDPAQRLRLVRTQLAAIEARLGRAVREPLRTALERYSSLDAGLVRAAGERLRAPRRRWETLAGMLESLSPIAVLSRGYALAFKSDGKLVKRAADLSPGELLTVRLGQGAVESRVERKLPGEV